MSDIEVIAAANFGKAFTLERECARLRAINAELLDALEEMMAAGDALTAFLLASDPKVMGEQEWRVGHKERSQRRLNSILAATAAIAKAQP